MTYIDFDGVIYDTEPLLFEDWNKNPNKHLLSEEDKIKYVQEANWRYIIRNAKQIDDSIYNLKHMNPEKTRILTLVYSLTEANEKITALRDEGVKQIIIPVPFYNKKTDLVIVEGNFLIDDTLRNLDDWTKCGGNAIFFDKFNSNTDGWNQKNINNYPKVLSLSKFKGE